MIGRTNEEGGIRKKNIFAAAVFITVLMAIALIAFSSHASARIEDRNYTQSGGTIIYNESFEGNKDTKKHGEPEDQTETFNVFVGEEIKFLNSELKSFPVTVSGPYTKEAEPGYREEPCISYEVGAEERWYSEGKPTKGYFKVVNFSNPNKEPSRLDEGGWFKIVEHKFKVELVEKREKVQEGKNFSIKMTSNPRENGTMKLTIEDKEKFSITDIKGNYIYEVPIAYENMVDLSGFADVNKIVEGVSFVFDEILGRYVLVFNTPELDMKEGKYKIILEDRATEVEKKVDIEVKEKEVEVDCPKEVAKGEDIVIKITSSFYDEKIKVTIGNYSESLTLDEEGKIKVKISTESMDYGTYKIRVEVCDTIETKYVNVKRSGASLEVPEDATVGDIVHIKGTAASGDFAVLLVDDVFKNKARITNEEFAWDWDTGGEPAEYREIEVFIVNESELSSTLVGETIGDAWQREHGVDTSATIFLFLPTFSMTVPKCIARGDDVVISGTAIGTAHVFVIAINYKGEVVFPPGGTAGGINARTTSVEDGKWEENIGELDSGRYTVIALYEGKDGITDAIKDLGKPNAKWEAGDKGKTLEQRVAILEDKLCSAGSDDQFGKADFYISTPKVILKEPKTVVEIGDEITVKAETNIKTGEKAFISLSQNSSSNNLKKTFALVENGSVNASINTSGLLPGKYNIGVDISGRASAEKEIILVEKKEVVEEGKEEIAQNKSLTEPGTVEKANESIGIGVGEGEINESYEEEEERKIPVNVWDLLIAVVVAIFISFAVRRRR